MLFHRLHYMRLASVVIYLLGACLGAQAAVTHYTVDKEVSSSRAPDGRLHFSLGGMLAVRTKEEPFLRVSVRGAEGKIWIEPLRVTVTSADGQQYPGGFTTCTVLQGVAEVLVRSSFTFTVDAGVSVVPKAGDYKVKIEAMATGPDGQSFLLEAESSITVKEPNQAAQTTPGFRPSVSDL